MRSAVDKREPEMNYSGQTLFTRGRNWDVSGCRRGMMGSCQKVFEYCPLPARPTSETSGAIRRRKVVGCSGVESFAVTRCTS